MRYEEAIEKLNFAEKEELSEKLKRLENRGELSAEEIKNLLSERRSQRRKRRFL